MGINFNLKLSLLLVLFCAANLFPIRSVSGSSVIKDIKSYSCCDPILKFDLSCDNILKMDNTNFAHIKLDAKQCRHPCKTIEDDQMILDGCINVTVTTVCNDMGAKETRTTYLGQECPQTQRSMSPQAFSFEEKRSGVILRAGDEYEMFYEP